MIETTTPIPVEVAVVGAGLVGRQHVEAVVASPVARLHSITDPAPGAAALAARHGVAHYTALPDALAARPGGVVLATPNALHLEGALACIEAGVPVLVEKPLAGTLADGAAMVAAAERAGVPLATGHHRRHNPKIAAAKAAIDAGKLGRLVAAHATIWLMKPDDYFAADWRRQKGGGPILINLVHEVDTLRHLMGDVAAVTAKAANAVRGFAVEDTAAVILEFQNGALGTLTLSDAIPAPWSWELTAGENPAYPVTGALSGMIGGTHGALALPDATVWSQPADARGWWSPISATHAAVDAGTALGRQIAQFAAVCRGDEGPLVSGRDGLRTLEVVEAIQSSAETGTTVRLAP